MPDRAKGQALSSERATWRAVVGVCLMGGVMLAGLWWAKQHGLLGPQAQAIMAAWIEPLGPWAPWAFLAFKIVTIAIGIPTAPVTMVGGVLFGLPGGILLNMAGATIGAAIPLLLVRYFGRELVAHHLKGRWAMWDEAIARKGFWAILVLRLLPVIPFGLINFGSGLSRVGLASYLWATLLGTIPGVLIYTYMGVAATEGSLWGVVGALVVLGLLALGPVLLHGPSGVAQAIKSWGEAAPAPPLEGIPTTTVPMLEVPEHHPNTPIGEEDAKPEAGIGG